MSRSKSATTATAKKIEIQKKSNELTPNEEKSIESLFDSLCDEEDPEIISMVFIFNCLLCQNLLLFHLNGQDGISHLCTDIGIDPASDVRYE